MDYSSLQYPILWLIIAIILVIIEAATMGIITIWFAIGALVALVAAFLGMAFLAQALIFIVVSAVLLYFTRPIVKKYLGLRPQKTNADRLVGEYAQVVEDISKAKGTGRVKVLGQEWAAITNGDEEILSGEKVKILQIEGVKLIVGK